MIYRYITAKDGIFWIEEDYDYNVGKLVPMIKVGYYLASYVTQLGIKHIVSNGDITSCVVRHIDEGNMYDSYTEALEALKKLEVKE